MSSSYVVWRSLTAFALTSITHRRHPLPSVHRITSYPLIAGQVIPEIVPKEDAQTLCNIIARVHNASYPSDVERSIRELALAWEDYYLPKFPVPFFQVRVADVRAAGGSLSTALELYDEVRGYTMHAT